MLLAHFLYFSFLQLFLHCLLLSLSFLFGLFFFHLVHPLLDAVPSHVFLPFSFPLYIFSIFHHHIFLSLVYLLLLLLTTSPSLYSTVSLFLPLSFLVGSYFYLVHLLLDAVPCHGFLPNFVFFYIYFLFDMMILLPLAYLLTHFFYFSFLRLLHRLLLSLCFTLSLSFLFDAILSYPVHLLLDTVSRRVFLPLSLHLQLF